MVRYLCLVCRILCELVLDVEFVELLTLSDQHLNPERGFEPGSSSECLLKFDTRSKPLGDHSRLLDNFINVQILFSLYQKPILQLVDNCTYGTIAFQCIKSSLVQMDSLDLILCLMHHSRPVLPNVGSVTAQTNP